MQRDAIGNGNNRLLSLSALSLRTGRRQAPHFAALLVNTSPRRLGPRSLELLTAPRQTLKSCDPSNWHQVIDVGWVNAVSIASINNFVGNGLGRYATQPASIAALRISSLSLAVMNMTGSLIPESVN